MKVIIAGSRSVADLDPAEAIALLEGAVSQLIAQGLVITEVVSGKERRGGDRLGELWAAQHGVPVKGFPPDWQQHGRAAGPIRNREMAAYADALIALWDGQSRGTAHMVSEARKRQLPVVVVTFDVEGNH